MIFNLSWESGRSRDERIRKYSTITASKSIINKECVVISVREYLL
jgi:hypothetical protein